MARNGDVHVGGGSAPIGDSLTVTAPAVFCPFLPRISPDALRVQRYADDWATRHGFLPTERDRVAFNRARFAYLMARAYPDASYSDLCLAVSWLTFTFMLDDHLETALGRAPDRQQRLADQMIEYLGGGRAPLALSGPLAGALADVWGRTRARTGPAWRERFVGHVAQYLAANAWEADNRSRDRVPSVTEYVRMRRHTAATAMFFDLAEALADLESMDDHATEAWLALLRLHADNVVAWFNDLVSWPKEAAEGDRHNLVLVVQQELRLPVADAVRHVTDRHDREVRAFVAVSDAVPARPQARRAAAGLEYWIRANVDWSRETGRYAPTDQRR
jgi:hypothetical protein